MNNLVRPDFIVQKQSGEGFFSSSVRILNDILAMVVFPESVTTTQFEQSSAGLAPRAGIIDKSYFRGNKPSNSCVKDAAHALQSQPCAMEKKSVDLDFNLEDAMTKLFGANYPYSSPKNNLAASSLDMPGDAINYPHWYSFASLFSGRVSNMQYQRAKVVKNISNKI